MMDSLPVWMLKMQATYKVKKEMKIFSIFDGDTASMRYDGFSASSVVENADFISSNERHENIEYDTSENLIQELSSCSSVQMPKPLKGRGRTKGFDATIMTSRKIKRKDKNSVFMLSSKNKKNMLSWFVSQECIKRVIHHSELVKVEDIYTDHSKIPDIAIECQDQYKHIRSSVYQTYYAIN
ncbi:uncharacterized protein LOC118201580 isoform X2 [Stegodyphus dumicola]|uniref:uncharacterized protein LOC118201580 isoform X2 n=1 Tax=Stegodyphus dumicola TaxID=202533 RepID=UPI0015B13ED9|nr:uncharacterized protein LOC118201580 isoform X2 [Stegodyphus dumicola]